MAGNPGSGVTYENVIKATKECKEIVGDDVLIFAGKWEDGNTEPILGDPQLGMERSKEIIKQLIDAGADCITLAMPGARFGISTEEIRELVTYIHTYKPGTLALSFLDGSVEGSESVGRLIFMLVDMFSIAAILNKHQKGELYFGVKMMEPLQQDP